jgi:succinate dehydrogenase flavin-adding protein (antitoxin of CptAB toxin-antitoxin module)
MDLLDWFMAHAKPADAELEQLIELIRRPLAG